MDKGIENVLFGNKSYLGIEFGSTRIKAVLIDEHHRVIAQGNHDWENKMVDGIWTYDVPDVIKGLQDCYHKLKIQVKERYDIVLRHIDGIGISAMMHGYLVFNEQDELLVPFRTWRNTITQEASEVLSEVFNFHIPQRWSVAHLYQSILNNEEHVRSIRYQTTLAGYVHYRLTGKRVLGIGEASGMFPIDTNKGCFHEGMLDSFDELVASNAFDWKLKDIMPEVLSAGDDAGVLSESGAVLLDPEGDLKAGVVFCPPEGDAGTGMIATNSIKEKCGNVSAGTSIFAMIVLEKELQKAYEAIDIVTTPDGKPVAMVHCNNGTSELNTWVNMYKELLAMLNVKISTEELYDCLFQKAMEGNVDGGGLLACNYLSGEHITGFEEGFPMVIRNPQGEFNLANFMLVQMYSSIATLKLGMDILIKEENITIENLFGHGGFFKTLEVGQKVMAAGLQSPVSVMETAGEGGAWGCAVLASYRVNQKNYHSLLDYLNSSVFAKTEVHTVQPDGTQQEGFNEYMKQYKKCLHIERYVIDEMHQKESEK
ncbi:MAG: FGGY-family carbohydrate kinase [Longicatena sp.]